MDLRGELTAYDDRLNATRQEARDAGRLRAQEEARTRALMDQRESLAYSRPSLFNPDGTAVREKNNPAAAIDKELATIDLDSLTRDADHKAALVGAAERERKKFAADNYAELVEAHRPDAEEVLEAIIGAEASLRDALSAYVNLAGHIGTLDEGLHPATRGKLIVPGRDHAAHLLQELERGGISLPVPVPDVSRLPVEATA